MAANACHVASADRSVVSHSIAVINDLSWRRFSGKTEELPNYRKSEADHQSDFDIPLLFSSCPCRPAGFAPRGFMRCPFAFANLRQFRLNGGGRKLRLLNLPL
jgi:hypothetical protein